MADSHNPAPSGMGLLAAAEALDGLMNDQMVIPEQPVQERRPTSARQAPKEAAEAPAKSASEETPEAAAEESPEPEPEEIEAAPEEEEPEGEQEAEPTYTVKIDGKEVPVTVSELLKGYSREGDYTRKTQALAEQRKEVESARAKHDEELQAVIQERQQYAQLLPAMQQQIAAAMNQEPDWEALIQASPVEYARTRKLWDDRQTALRNVQAEQQRVQQQQQQDLSVYMQRQKMLAVEKIKQAIPELSDDAKLQSELNAITEHAMQNGFSRERLQSMNDAADVIALRKAMLYDQLMSRAKTVKPQPQASPKPLPAGSSETAPRASSQRQKAQQRLAKSGRVADAAAYFETLLE